VTEPTDTEPRDEHPAAPAVTEALESVTPESAAPESVTPESVTPEPEAPESAAPAPAKDRRVLRAVLRWTAATVAFAAFGTGAAYAVTVPHRADLPGLATPSDGRWDFPALTPVGKGQANPGGHHLTDLRQLLLPKPKGAKADPALPGREGWYAEPAFAKLFSSGSVGSENARLKENAVRHIAATGWTMPDGTHTRIFLLQFGSAPYAGLYEASASGDDTLATAVNSDPDSDSPGTKDGVPKDASVTTYNEEEPSGATHDRYAYIVAGDVVALVIQSHPHRTATVPFRQTATLQAQLLG
jgi:hypothetical protein